LFGNDFSADNNRLYYIYFTKLESISSFLVYSILAPEQQDLSGR